MKKFIVLFVALATIFIACQKKSAPTASTNTNTNAASTNNTNATATPETAKVAYASADIDAGKVIYNSKCTKCHAAKPVESFNEERWTKILKSMIPKAKLDENESRQVTAYAMSNAKK